MRRIVLACVAAGLAGTAAPIPAANAEPAFGGYSTEARSTPLKVEVYEPVVPIPTTPQAELDFAYTKVEAASGPTGAGVASWLWPGDSVGEGCKTFVEQLKLGETGLCKDGYPVQVNSRTPGEPSEQRDEPFPGALMRTSSDAEGVRSTVGWSNDCDVSSERDEGGDQPKLPGLPDGPPDPLSSLGAAITGKDRAAEEPGSGCAMPKELAAVVDFGGMVSTSRTETVGDTVQATATSKLSDVSILGGVITADSISVTSTTTTNGRRPTASGVSKVVGLELAGTPITVGRDGVQLADQKAKLPDLPPDPEKALAQMGVSLVLPKPERSARGDSGSAAFEGLQIVIDTRPLRSHLDDIPFDEVTRQIPEEELRRLVGAATQLSPKFVITAGNTAAEVLTVPKMELDLDLPAVDPSELNGAAAPPASGSSGTSGGVAGGDAGAAAPALDGGADAAGDAGGSEALAVQPASAGLPPLASIPGALMVGGLVMASGIGWWLQKIGGLVLGGAGSCAHGLETGVPDLRKA